MANINKSLVNELDKDIENTDRIIKNEQENIKKYEQEIGFLKERIRGLQKDLSRKTRARAMYLGEDVVIEDKEKEKEQPVKEKKKKEKKEVEAIELFVEAKKEEVKDENQS